MSSIFIHNNSVQAGIDLSKDLFGKFHNHWIDESDNRGMWRPGYSKEENEAHGAIIDAAKALDVEAYQDLAGNTYIIKPGLYRKAPVVMSGSHLDAVPKGGAYDGPAGAIIAVSAIAAMNAQGIVPPQDYVAISWRNEESTWFAGQYGIGSKLATGDLSSEFLFEAKQKRTGRTLASHMDSIGLSSSDLAVALDKHGKLLPQESIGRAIEFHIEQGAELDEVGKEIGFVNKVRAALRFPDYVEFHGEAGHTGSLPMHKRKSAGMAMSEFIISTSQKLKELSLTMDLVYEPSIIEMPNANQTRVGKFARMKFDIRSVSKEALEKSCEIVKEEAIKVAKNNGCSTNAKTMKVSIATPQEMSGVLRSDFMRVADQYSMDTQVMKSGANHDICSLTEVAQRELIFLRHNGISHNPDESLGLEGEDPFKLGTSFSNAIRLQTHMAMLPTNVKMEKLGVTFGNKLQQYGAQRLNM